MDFPAITVCASGLHKDLIKKALETDYNEWKADRKGNDNDLLEEFMSENFGLDNKKISVMDIIDTLVAPTEESNEANIVVQNELACQRSDENTRRKRENGKFQIQF